MTGRTRALVSLGVVAGGVWWFWGRGEGDEVAGAEAALVVDAGLVGPRDRLAVPAGPGLAALSGVVRGPGGQAVANATVCTLVGWGQAGVRPPPRCVSSGRDGYYRIDGLLPLRSHVSAMAPGYVASFHARGEGAGRQELVVLRDGEEARGIDVQLVGGGIEVVGVVRDLSGGAVEGAQVMSGGPSAGTGIAIATSGGEGEFSLWVQPGMVDVWTRAEGYVQGSDRGVAPGHRFEVVLTPESVVVGKVVRASDGAPVAEATVDVGNGMGVSSDAAGRFRIEGLMPGAYKATAVTDELYGMAGEQVHLGLGETSEEVVISMHPAMSVAGTVVVAGVGGCETGGHIGMVRVADQHGVGSAALGPDGQAKLRGLQAGEYKIFAHCNGMLSAESYPPVVLADRGVSGLRWEVTRGLAMRGVVVDQRGRPVAGLKVLANAVMDPSRAQERVRGSVGATTDAEGRFVMTALLPGKYSVVATNERQQRVVTEKPLEVVVSAGGDLEGVRIELPASGGLRGSVRDVKGRGVARVKLSLTGPNGPTIMAADDGSFVFPELLAGEYRVLAMRGTEVLRGPDRGEDDVQGTAVVVRAGAVEAVQLVVEAADGEIRGVVRDADGGVVGDAFIEAGREPESAAAVAGEAGRARWRRYDERPILTDADGRFVLVGLRAGKYSVRAQRRGGGEGLREHVGIGEDVVLTLADSGSLAGTVVTAGGRVPEEFTVSVRDRVSGFYRSDTFYRTGGAWRLRDLEDGDFEIEVSAAGGLGTGKVTLAAGEVKTGVTVQLVGMVTVRGSVVDLEGTPVAGVEVVIPNGNGYSMGLAGEHVSDAAGRFTLKQAPVGVVRVVAAPRGREFQATTTMVTIAEGREDVELAPIRVVRETVKHGAVGDLGFVLRRSEPTDEPLTGRHVVAVVRPGGPAARAGLVVGDEIVAVGGQSVIGADGYLYYNLTRVSPGATVRLGLGRGAVIDVIAGKPS